MSALECQRKELEAEWTEQFAEMERKLNDACREHAKAGMLTRITPTLLENFK